jgi:hypothetical protein
MSTPAARIVQFASGPHIAGGVAITDVELAADSTLQALVPMIEPGSVGPPPVVPAFVKQASRGWRVRNVGTRSGPRAMMPLQTKTRGRYSVEWGPMNADQYQAMLEFLGRGGVAGGLRGFTIEPDGEGNGSRTVRPLELPTWEFLGRGVYKLNPMQCEECF